MNQNLYMSTLLKAFDILDCFQNDRQELGISDIAAMVDMPVSSVHRIIQSLEFVGMLTQNREKPEIRARLPAAEPLREVRPVSAVPADRLRYVDQLGKLTGETVNLSARAGDHITHIYHAESHFVLRPNFPLYAPFPAYSTSVGRVFLSYMSDASIEWIYENNKEEIGTSVDEFLAMLHQARRDGCALDDEAFNAGLRCVAAPVFFTPASHCSPSRSPRRCRGWTTRPTRRRASSSSTTPHASHRRSSRSNTDRDFTARRAPALAGALYHTYKAVTADAGSGGRDSAARRRARFPAGSGTST